MALVDRVAQWPEQWRSEGRIEGRRERLTDLLRAIEQREPDAPLDQAQEVFLDIVAKLPEQSRRDGWAEGARYTLFVIAEERFGAEMAFRVRRLLSSTDDPSRLGDVTRWIMACPTEHELIDRISAICDC